MVPFRSDLAKMNGAEHGPGAMTGPLDSRVWSFGPWTLDPGLWTPALLLLALSLATRSYGADLSGLSDALKSWLAAQTNIQSWSANFIQTRTLKALTTPLSANGQVWFAAPNR